MEICTFAQHQLLTDWFGSQFSKEGIDFSFHSKLLEWLPAVVTLMPGKSYHCSELRQVLSFLSLVLKGAALYQIQ